MLGKMEREGQPIGSWKVSVTVVIGPPLKDQIRDR